MFNQTGRTWTFSGDLTTTVYTVTGGSNTSWTISPHYAGTTLSGQTVTSTCPPFTVYPLKQAVGTYGFFANLAAQFPNCSLWIPVMPYMSDACLQAVADEIAPFLRPGQTVVVEQGDEHWNTPNFQTGILDWIYGNLLAYIQPGTLVNPYWAANSAAVSNVHQAYALISAHQHDVMAARLATYGKGIQVLRFFGSEYVFSSLSGTICSFASATGTVGGANPRGLQKLIPVAALGIGAYRHARRGRTPHDSTYTSACSPGGLNWPVAAIHDVYRHFLKYNNTLWAVYSGHYAAIAAGYVRGAPAFGQVGGLPALIAYECRYRRLTTICRSRFHMIFSITRRWLSRSIPFCKACRMARRWCPARAWRGRRSFTWAAAGAAVATSSSSSGRRSFTRGNRAAPACPIISAPCRAARRATANATIMLTSPLSCRRS